jgi:hypothetical protein
MIVLRMPDCFIPWLGREYAVFRRNSCNSNSLLPLGRKVKRPFYGLVPLRSSNVLIGLSFLFLLDIFLGAGTLLSSYMSSFI